MTWLVRFFLVGVFVVAGTVPAAADHGRARELVEQGKILPLEALVTKARAEQPGHLLEVELEQEEGVWVYEIELLDEQGRIWELYYDAQSGELIRRGQGEED